MATTKELDALDPEPRVYTIAGEPVEVTKIPLRATLRLMKLVKARADEGRVLDTEDTLEIVELICKPNNPHITRDFLLDQCDEDEVNEFVSWILTPLKKKQKDAESKNRVRPSKK